MEFLGRAAAASTLREVAALGPYFVVSTGSGDAGPGDAGAGWRPLPERDPERLLGLVEAYAQRLGTRERRVAASILFQGLASRLWSPAVACAAYGMVLDLSDLHWRWAPGAPIALWLPEPVARRSADPASDVHTLVVDGQLRPLRTVLLQVTRLADGLLWGNAASALAGTLQAAGRRPALAAAMSQLVGDLLTRDPLAAAGTVDTTGRFVRRSCCLYYRVPPGGELCGDCCLAPRP
ncbi:(2Fe-2S)-binding protein [Actinomadura sp. HBU206391]|uniref:(2Fe-2S)-binding protein n=1 Tax=Actinomadura sp. HBU206391 TaxID=2731692 RepID=UPI0016500256|nr:(2Fe-2S)-binding protein [Actinomadura sp. HBU206391]MBC6459016.1 (2Fe-2S)-binding protein [Actinomadura sp. HBU206391]